MDNNATEIINLKYLVTALYNILEENKGHIASNNDKWTIDCESLLQKITCHALTILDLTETTKPSVPSINSNISFIDYLSIYSIVRTALESYLVFYYIFQDEKVGKGVKKIRHKIWHASALSQRQKQSILTDKMKEVLKEEKSELLILRRKILKSKIFNKSVNLHDRNKLINKKPFDWKPSEGWRGIAKLSPLSENYWIDVYNMLSSVVHSNATITYQLRNQNTKELQEGMTLAAISYLNLVIPLLIEGYSVLFPKVKTLIQNDKKLSLAITVAKSVVSSYKA